MKGCCGEFIDAATLLWEGSVTFDSTGNGGMPGPFWKSHGCFDHDSGEDGDGLLGQVVEDEQEAARLRLAVWSAT